MKLNRPLLLAVFTIMASCQSARCQSPLDRDGYFNHALKLSSSGRFLAVCGERNLGEGSILIWDRVEAKPFLFRKSRGTLSCGFSEDERFFVAGGQAGELFVLDLQSKQMAWELSDSAHGGHPVDLCSIAGDLLISSGGDGFIRIWDMKTRAKRLEIQAIEPGDRSDRSRDDKTVLRLPVRQSWFYGAALSTKRRQLVVSSGKSNIYLVDIDSRAVREMPTGLKGCVAVACSSDGKWAAIGGSNDDRRIAVIEVETGKVVQTLDGHSASVIELAFSSDGKFLLSGGVEDGWKCHSIETGKRLCERSADRDRSAGIAFLPERSAFVALSHIQGARPRAFDVTGQELSDNILLAKSSGTLNR